MKGTTFILIGEEVTKIPTKEFQFSKYVSTELGSTTEKLSGSNSTIWFLSSMDESVSLRTKRLGVRVPQESQIRKCGEMVSSRSPKPLLGVRIPPLAQMPR